MALAPLVVGREPSTCAGTRTTAKSQCGNVRRTARTRGEARTTALQFVAAARVLAPHAHARSTSHIEAALRRACDGRDVESLAFKGDGMMGPRARDTLAMIATSGVEAITRRSVDFGERNRAVALWLAIGGGALIDTDAVTSHDRVILEDAAPNVFARLLRPSDALWDVEYVTADAVADLAWDVRERGLR